MINSEYLVSGMTCGHCEGAVRRELAIIPGVAGVTVDLTTGRVSISSESVLDEAAVASAIDEAGYELIGGTAPGAFGGNLGLTAR